MPIQPWSERIHHHRNKSSITSSSIDSSSEDETPPPPPPPLAPPSPPPQQQQTVTTPGTTRNLIRKLERQHLAWMQRNNRPPPPLISKSNDSNAKSKTLTRNPKSNKASSSLLGADGSSGHGLLRRSDTMLLAPVSGLSSTSSRVISLETPEFTNNQNKIIKIINHAASASASAD